MVSDGQDLYKRILKSRKLDEQMLEVSLDNLPDEALFANIDSVAERIREAIYNNEPMVIFGHDDPDGITSTYILYNFLNSCGYQRHSYYIPNRNLESHGIQQGFVDFVQKGGFKLVITVDNGISAYAGVEQLNALGCDVLITDHHLIQADMIPNAHSIMNPQLPYCKYPFKALAGVGVALMLIRYLAKKWEHPIDPASYFWAAVGSIADKVPMIGLNRAIVRYVLENFDQVQDQTVQFLLRNYSRVSTPTDVFNFITYTSRLIANGREEGGNHTALRFILQLSDAKARLFEDLEEQKNSWESELNRVFSFLDTLSLDFVGNFFVYYDDDNVIPYSLLGTASTYIVNRLGIPTIMLKHHNGHTVCEGRCGEGFNMVEAFNSCKKHLKQFGGHVKAAGFTMEPSEYDAFLECFNDYLVDNFNAPDENAPLLYDAECTIDELNPETWQSLELLLPWGQQNPEPSILIRGINQGDISALNVDNGSVHLPKERCVDCLLTWRSPNQIRILKILDS
ncbi:MAG: DHH family phosphoesterase [Candidatus Cloacimonetes bacterium]|nr:DHH family phosphoesterase [Candidatus Cloacimonadota bacterium]MDD3096265.1 DHH family phosphoesterase [Candidatus Cloacimonadota bacterium]